MFTALGSALACGMAQAARAASAEPPALVAAFEAVCMKAHGDLARVRDLADRNGWKPVAGPQPPNAFHLVDPQAREASIGGAHTLLIFGDGPDVEDETVMAHVCGLRRQNPDHAGVSEAVRGYLGVPPGFADPKSEIYGFSEGDGRFAAVPDAAEPAANRAGKLSTVTLIFNPSSVLMLYVVSAGVKP